MSDPANPINREQVIDSYLFVVQENEELFSEEHFDGAFVQHVDERQNIQNIPVELLFLVQR